jgi:phosphoglycerate dehydrogenase-like enzyme
MNLISKNKIKILSDFRSDLEMFNLSKKNLNIIKKNFKSDITIQFLNLKKIKKKYDADIYWGTRINNEIINRIENLKWIHFGSVGVDKINLELTKSRKIKVTNSKGVNTDAMINLIIYYLIDTSRKLNFLTKKTKRSNYETLFSNCKDLPKQKICILGYGRISKKIEKNLSLLNINYKYFSRRIFNSKKIINEKNFIKSLHNFDTIINLLKADKKNINFLNVNLFKKMKKEINLILVGRITTINLKDLYSFLSKNKRSTCYIDGISTEENHHLFNKINKLENVFISPHIGGYFKDYWNIQTSLFQRNLSLYLNKKRLINEVRNI